MPETIATAYKLDDFSHAEFRLSAMNPAWAAELGDGLAQIDPWQRLGYSAQALTRYLGGLGQGRHAIVVLSGDAPAACLTVRPNWLRGPLLELLAVLPAFQGCGLGKQLIAWLVEQTLREKHGNLWTISSEFNTTAQAFYRREGFELAGTLPDLICPSETEVLLRLRLDRAESGSGLQHGQTLIKPM